MTGAEGSATEAQLREATQALATTLRHADSPSAVGRAVATLVAQTFGDLCIARIPPAGAGAHPDATIAAQAQRIAEGTIEDGLLSGTCENIERIFQPHPRALGRLLGTAFEELVEALGAASVLVFPLQSTLATAQLMKPGGALLVLRARDREPHDAAAESVLSTWALLVGGRLLSLAQTAKLETYRKRRTGPGVHALEEEVASRGRALRRSHRDLAQFASVVSHDLKQPLRTVSLYAELLQSRLEPALADNAEARQALDFVRAAAEHGRELVEDLLEFSRVTGDVTMSFSEVSLDEVVSGVVTGPLAPDIQERGASVTVHPLPYVGGSQVRLAQLMRNLLSNSLKFAGAKPAVIDVSARELDHDVEIVVADQGIGVPAEQQQAIFEVFHRLHTRDEIRGTGVGLALCRSIAELHSGSIRAEDNPGGGLRVLVTLPKRQ